MKKHQILLLCALAVCFVGISPKISLSVAVDDTTIHPACVHCGMDREKFNYSRMLIEYADGKSVGVCSLHCAAVELSASTGKAIKSVKVADMISRKLINAEQAFWVIGGSSPGIMSKRAKWAFIRKQDAGSFIEGKGGLMAGYAEALKEAYEDMYEDTKMIREKKQTAGPDVEVQKPH